MENGMEGIMTTSPKTGSTKVIGVGFTLLLQNQARQRRLRGSGMGRQTMEFTVSNFTKIEQDLVRYIQ
jgi:hypothetical protein